MNVKLKYKGKEVKASSLGNDLSFGVAVLDEKVGEISVVHYNQKYEVIREYK